MTSHAHRRPVRAAATLALLAALAALALPGCGRGSKQAATTTTSTSVAPSVAPSSSSSSSSSSTSTSASAPPPTASTATTAKPPAATSVVTLYFVHGDHLAAVRRTVTPSGAAVATAAMKALLTGPTAAERTAGLSTAIPSATTLRGVSVRDGRGFVDLSGAYESGGGTLSMQLRLAQVVFTMTQFRTVDYVVFMLNGVTPSVFSGEGLILDNYERRSDFELLGVVPEVLVESPGWGSAVSSPVRVRGSADVFEAVFRVELTDWDGRIVASQIVHATSGTGTRGTFDVTLRYTTGRTGLGSLILSYDSPKDGRRVVVEEVPLTVRR